MTRKIELLAPAKNLECGIAAIDHGADAVYIGAPAFGARHAAGNSLADISKLCAYAHQFGAKVYATVNTIVYDEETSKAKELIHNLQNCGIDAILIQDMGLMRTRDKDEDVVFHASTQTDNRSVAKVLWLRSLGFRRVVLARELTIDEIREIHEAAPDVELEAFVHGALCVSYSGQCYASQHCFGRSANRGECAQLCRMRYSLHDADGRRIADDAYFLSLKDLCQIDYLKEMIDAGVMSFKIEGRLKDAAYVKNVVAAYSQRLNEIISNSNGSLQRASLGTVELSFEPDLRRSFNRGYTNYFLHGRKENVASFLTPKAIGERVGRVKEIRGRSLTVAGTSSFANGDGLCFIDDEGQMQGFRVNRAEGNRLFPLQMPRQLRQGQLLYRTQDQDFDRQMARKTAVRTIPLTIAVALCDDNTIVLSAKDATGTIGGSAELHLNDVQEAQKPQLENIRRQVTKLGGTAFACSEISIDERLDHVFVPSSMIADLRRRAIESIVILHDSEATNATVTPTQATTTGNAESAEMPHYTAPHLYNAANAMAKDFYKARGIDHATAYELDVPKDDTLLMQCRHCLRYALGKCVKHGGERPEWREPLYLSLSDGRRFRLEFDCKRCQMNVYS